MLGKEAHVSPFPSLPFPAIARLSMSVSLPPSHHTASRLPHGVVLLVPLVLLVLLLLVLLLPPLRLSGVGITAPACWS